MILRTLAPALAATVLLAGCGGSTGDDDDFDGGGDGTVPLRNRSDVAREVGLVVFVGDTLSTVVGFDDTNAKALHPMHAHPFGAARTGSALRSKAVAAKARVSCGFSGSSEVSDPATKTRNFSYFTNLTRTVDFTVIEDDDCEDVEDEFTNGVLEAGRADPENDGSTYGYVVAGRGNDPYELSGDGFFEAVRGTAEVNLEQDGTYDARAVLDGSFRESNDYRGTYAVGLRGEPIQLLSLPGGFAIFGPYDYSSSLCDGGIVDVTTKNGAPLSFGSDDVPSGGTLTLESGNDAVTVTFTPGDATVEYDDGRVETLPRSLLREELQGGSC